VPPSAQFIDGAINDATVKTNWKADTASKRLAGLWNSDSGPTASPRSPKESGSVGVVPMQDDFNQPAFRRFLR